MSNLYMPVSAGIISVILLIIYCSKEKIKIKENNIYFIMLICILLDSLFVTVIYIQDLALGKLEYIKFFNRCDYVTLVAWSSCLCRYAYTVIHKNDENHQKWRDIMQQIISLGALCAIVLIWILRLDGICEGDKVLAITGPAVYFTFACCAVNVFLSILVILLNVKKATKQIAPVFICLVMAGVCAAVYYVDPGVSGVSMGLTIVNLTMYFTIENPDVQMLAKVNEAKEQALRANMAKTDFLSSMSHEIRTPINAIMGLADCIQNDESLDKAQEDAKDILMASETLLELINGILDISKIEAGRMEVTNKEYDLLKMTEKLGKLIKARIGEKPIDLRISLDKNIPGVLYGDEAKLRQIMTNLLTNAVKYTEEGYIDFKIDCTNVDDTANLTIAVTDTGHGIKEDMIDSLFDKFTRLEEDRNTQIEGTGLGLAITKQFIEMLEGTVDVNSKYGVGTTFTVHIAQKIRSYEQKAEEKTVEEQREYPGNRILVVDDIPTNLIVAKRFLELLKVDVDTASSGEECIQMCGAQRYNMVLLDDMMPKMSGTETLNELKKLPSFDMPVIAFTANALDGMSDSYINDGYSDYLSKPIVKAELRRVLDKFLI